MKISRWNEKDCLPIVGTSIPDGKGSSSANSCHFFFFFQKVGIVIFVFWSTFPVDEDEPQRDFRISQMVPNLYLYSKDRSGLIIGSIRFGSIRFDDPWTTTHPQHGGWWWHRVIGRWSVSNGPIRRICWYGNLVSDIAACHVMSSKSQKRRNKKKERTASTSSTTTTMIRINRLRSPPQPHRLRRRWLIPTTVDVRG